MTHRVSVSVRSGLNARKRGDEVREREREREREVEAKNDRKRGDVKLFLKSHKGNSLFVDTDLQKWLT